MNGVQIPDGTAAVSAKELLFDESRSLGKPGRLSRSVGGDCPNRRKSEELLKKSALTLACYGVKAQTMHRNTAVAMKIAAAFFYMVRQRG